jgi:nitrate reductase delta subunit
MKIFQVISILLDYPTAEVVGAEHDLLDIVATSTLQPSLKTKLNAFITERCASDLMDWQSEYDGLFERGRSLSLLLFEHIHGESRDRGQAMVNLLDQYKQAGLDLDKKELPDYIPLYLEFLSTQGEENGQIGLEEIAPILAVLACRADQRETSYATLFHTLLALSKAEVDLSDIKAQIVNEKRDDTAKELDKVWEEEMVTFMGNDQTDSACGSSNKPSETQRKDQYVPLSTDALATDALANELFKEAANPRA